MQQPYYQTKDYLMNTMTPSILEDRASTGRFDPEFRLPSDTIHELVRLATKAPSAFNLQNWYFLAVQSDAAKKTLQEVSYGQRQPIEAAVTFIVCGLTHAHHALYRHLQASVDAGILPASLQKTWSDMAIASHEGNAQQQRDEAIRSASFVAMSLLVAAKEMGLDAGTMGGFDSRALKQRFALSDPHIPVVLVPIGRASDLNWPQKIRRPVREVMEIR